jgi:hypothetical protein
VTESTSAVEQAIAARIQAQRIKVQAAKQRRDDLAAARKRGLAHRHARKLKALAEQELGFPEKTKHRQDDDPEETP